MSSDHGRTRSRGPGPLDVRSHRGPLRPDELGHDGGHAPPLARARGRPRAASAPATARSTCAAAQATSRSSWPARVGPRGRVVGLDFSAPMLELAQSQVRAARRAPVAWVQGNALELPFADGEFDAATVGFGARNVVDLERGIAEMARVVRPGGKGGDPRDHDAARPPLKLVLRRLVRPHRAAARARWPATATPTPTCPSSVRRFPPAEELAALMHARRPARRPLPDPGRRHHRDPLRPCRREPHEHRRRGRAARRRADARADGAGRGLLEQTSAGDGAELRAAARGHPCRRRQAAAAAAGAASAAGIGRGEALVRAAAAVELIHMATLVHDDVVDNALLRRGRPTVFAQRRPGGGDRDRRLPVLARVRAARRERATTSRCGCSSDACLALARGELAQRHDAYRLDVDEERYLLRCELKTAQPVRGRVPARRAGGRAAGARGRGARGVRQAARPRVPDARRPARRQRAGGAHRQAPRHRPARRHGHAAADPRRPRTRAGRLDLRAVTTREEAEALCDRIAATGALERDARRARRRWWTRRRSALARHGGRRSSRRSLTDGGRPHRRPLRVSRSRSSEIGTAGPGPAAGGG